MSDCKWIGEPVDCVYQSFNTGRFIFYRSVRKGNEIFSEGDFILINRKQPGNPELDEVCKIKALYESKEERHREAPHKVFIQPYVFAKSLKEVLSNKLFAIKGNEIVEDCNSVHIITNVLNIKSKCIVEFYPVRLPVNIVHNSAGYYCRYKYLSDEILPVLPEDTKLVDDSMVNKEQNISNEFSSELARKEPKKHTIAKSHTLNGKNSAISNKETSRPQLTGEICDEEHAKHIQVNSPLHSVRKNLCESFNSDDDDNNSYLDYSIIENTPEEEKVKIKLRVSKKRISSIPSTQKYIEEYNCHEKKKAYNAFLVDKKLNKSIEEDSKKKTASAIVIIEKNKMLTNKCHLTGEGLNGESPALRRRQYSNNSPSIRRSNRAVTRISYAEYVSPIKGTPPKRTRLLSEKSETNGNSFTDTNKSNLKHRESARNSHLSEKQNNSPGIGHKTPSRQCKSKYYYYISDSDSDEDESNLVVTGKRQVKTPKHFLDSYQSSRKSQKMETDKVGTKQEATPRSSRKSKKIETDKEGTKQEATPRRQVLSRLVEVSPKGTPKKTPSSRIKLLRSGTITPTVQNRNKAILLFDSPLMKARNQLHVSYVPKALPCREKEYQDIYNFLSGKLADGCGGCMYVSGVPGTGKTATVTSVITNLLEDAKKDLLDDFYFININGMKLTEPRQAYVEIMRQLSKKTLPWEQAQTMLEERFTKSKQKNRTPIVLLVDELDILCTKRQDVVYNLLDWPMKAKTQLIVVTIANTMDLPERLLMNRVTSRLGLTRLTFQAYTHKQLQEIVMKRLAGTNSFNPDAIQLVARKVASVSGDARRALDICRRAAEIAELEGPDTYVSLNHVNEALNAMITQPKVQAIKHCSYLEQLLLQSVVAEMERTGVEETVFSDVFKMLISVSAIHGFKSVNRGLALAAVRRLSASRLLITDQKCSDITLRIILNVSTDDVYYALRKD